MKIAIFGATSQIAHDLILSFVNDAQIECVLFSRNSHQLEEKNTVCSVHYPCKGYEQFSVSDKYDAIVNFIGVGSPLKVKAIGSSILDVTLKYDLMILEYLDVHKATKYLFISSGAVYGKTFEEPVDKNSITKIKINQLDSSDWYRIAKLYAETRHRALDSLNIVDIRIFNYFSHTQNMQAGFLITDIVLALKNKSILKTSGVDIVRDFITPIDFYNLISCILMGKATNTTLDCYTQSPISKLALLSELSKSFGLNYEIESHEQSLNSTGLKDNYYSLNQQAKIFGYKPKYSSIDGIFHEISCLKL